ncbi:hypothetical protein BU15DRAFT_66388 [Melanogaster broomeanus]|nr:hypothetical protein BU15DRAFT_66388 [Melanogaster broomeanus]
MNAEYGGSSSNETESHDAPRKADITKLKPPGACVRCKGPKVRCEFRGDGDIYMEAQTSAVLYTPCILPYPLGWITQPLEYDFLADLFPTAGLVILHQIYHSFPKDAWMGVVPFIQNLKSRTLLRCWSNCTTPLRGIPDLTNQLEQLHPDPVPAGSYGNVVVKAFRLGLEGNAVPHLELSKVGPAFLLCVARSRNPELSGSARFRWSKVLRQGGNTVHSFPIAHGDLSSASELSNWFGDHADDGTGQHLGVGDLMVGTTSWIMVARRISIVLILEIKSSI